MPDPSPSQSLTREQAVLIASRLFAAYLLFWVIADLTYLPHEILSLTHYMQETGSVLGTNTTMPQTTYVLRGTALELFGNLLRLALSLVGAGWFYRCGPRIHSFFSSTTEQTTAPSS